MKKMKENVTEHNNKKIEQIQRKKVKLKGK